MHTFKGRPLAVFCFIFIFSSLLAFTLTGFVKIVILSIVAVVAVTFLMIYILGKKKSSKIIYSFICFVFALLAVGESYLYFDKHLQKSEFTGETHTVVGTVQKRESNADFYTAYTVQLKSIDGEQTSGKLFLECEYICALMVNEIITADICVYALTESAEVTYSISSLISDGYMLYGVSGVESDYNVLGVAPECIRTFFGDLNVLYSTKLSGDIKGDAGGLVVALLLGNKSGLSNAVNGNFRKIGVSHILSLSGMHMSIIIGVIELLFRKIRMHKNIRCLFVAVSALSYLALTGFYISAIRSVFMILSVYLCYYFATEGDSITALLGIISAIILITPYAICDGGMWLSFLATFGILIASPYVSQFCGGVTKPIKIFSPVKKLIRYLVSGILITLVALLSISVITCCFFGEFSLFTPVANLIIIPFAYILLVFSLIYMIFSFVPVINVLLIKIIQLIGNTMLDISDTLADIRGIVVNVDYWFVKLFVIIMMFLLVLSLFINLKRKSKILLVPVVTVSLIICSIASFQYINRFELSATYLRNKSSEEIVLTSRNKAVICDFSDGSSTNFSFAYNTVRENHITEIEVLVLSHYHERHKMSFKRLNENTRIRNLWLPQPVNEKEYYIMEELIRIADSERVFVTIYNSDDNLYVFGDVKIEFSSHTYIKRSTHPVLIMKVEKNNSSLVYLGCSVHEAIELPSINIENSDYLIFGVHGPVIKTGMPYSFANSEAKYILVSNLEIMEGFDFTDENYNYFVGSNNIFIDAEKYKIIIK